MRKNKSDILIIIVFFIVIYGFSISYFFIKEKLDNTNTENRVLASRPELEFATILNYPKNYENYFNDHLPFRNQFRNAWTKLNQDVFKVSVDNRVILGKDGWLFYTGDNSIQQAQGISTFSDMVEIEIIENLQEQREKLNSDDIEFYVMVLPNKENIYRNYLPDVIEFKDGLTRTEKLVERIKDETTLNIIYPKDELLLKDEEFFTYYKHDTHWNEYGAFITFELFYEMFTGKKSDFRIGIVEEEKSFGDLTHFANLTGIYETEMVPVVKGFLDDVSYQEEIITSPNNNMRKTFNPDAKYSKKVLFVGDSFREAITPYFAKMYEEVMFLHRSDYDSSILEEFEPDIVILEAVERYSDLLGNFEF